MEFFPTSLPEDIRGDFQRLAKEYAEAGSPKVRLGVVNMAIEILEDEFWWRKYPGVQALFDGLQLMRRDLVRALRAPSARVSAAVPAAAPVVHVSVPAANPADHVHVPVTAPATPAQTPNAAASVRHSDPAAETQPPPLSAPQTTVSRCRRRRQGHGSGVQGPETSVAVAEQLSSPAEDSLGSPTYCVMSIAGIPDSVAQRIDLLCSPPVAFLFSHLMDNADSTADQGTREQLFEEAAALILREPALRAALQLPGLQPCHAQVPVQPCHAQVPVQPCHVQVPVQPCLVRFQCNPVTLRPQP
ncbi:uncharacterized protein LOC129603008 isoform X2 [Betta splendens]|uniref:Uncharacterized protein LOC129603008 isoform X2 n=1 Tax=Betta splendens TaxID=158456 RepID=A0A9W2X9P6_BETSP|nr:uncharacterized protein LOC129603008 isoform X2 [Betta splendens]